ncbi:UDP-N-acetylglucosamine transporter yea4 [Penicillium longicatenatum]|uniref:UDP-N-acetylglucosamine transporter yea4 n=1 Tax=Penicillium longicatenatum TaxID=1561947 RepID=UPI0025483F7F|nr:UDP-N-acetylglucosamine transporter yea4 [Penicillium longicatenatum]KAJ5660756.1 UDP-N-acetylglucosamine transporter yea4 [Penicillium longicatenatum]
MIHDGDSLRQRPDTYKANVSKVEATKHTVTASSAEQVHRSAESGKLKDAGLIAAAAHAAVPNWANMLLMVSLIFGGCCANVFTLEAIIKEQSTAGPLITFAQFVLCAIFTLPHFLSFSAGPRNLFLSPRAIPLRSWLIYTAFFVSVNMLNNWAFAYKISVPLHIIIRSGGPVASMIVGYIFNGRRYSSGQILAVVMLTAGVVAAALADAQAKGQNLEMTPELDAAVMTTTIGFTILALAMVLSAFQGIYADRLYATYGRDHWKEALFYSHTLSLPLFITSTSQLSSQWQVVASSPSFLSKISDGSAPALSDLSSNTTPSVLSTVILHYASIQSLLDQLPVQVAYLMMNALTQYLCIRGVHLLSAKSSSLTVTVVLNIRKLVSLLLSIYLFGNHLGSGVLIGAILVFLGGGLYGFEGARLRKVATKKVQ